MREQISRSLVVAAVTIGFAFVPAQADTFYWTNFALGEIDTTLTPGGATNQVFATSDGSAPDSLIFNLAGNKTVYTTTSGVWESNTDGSGAVKLASNTLLGSSNIQDLALEPGGNSVLVSVTGTGGLWRIDLTGANPPALLNSFGGGAGLRGLTYVGNNLFAVVGGNLEQLDPTTGTPIAGRSLALGSNGDGLTFDSSTGNLFVTSANARTLWEVSTSLSLVASPTCDLTVCGNFDGVVADGSGNIDIADTSGQIVQFKSGTFTPIATGLSGIDDLAPLSGLGAPPAPPSGMPEPNSLGLLFVGVPLLLWKCRRRAVN